MFSTVIKPRIKTKAGDDLIIEGVGSSPIPAGLNIILLNLKY